MYPAARFGDPVTHDLIVPAGVVGMPSTPCPQGQVLIEGQKAAHVCCMVVCMGTTIAGPLIPHPIGPSPPCTHGPADEDEEEDEQEDEKEEDEGTGSSSSSEKTFEIKIISASEESGSRKVLGLLGHKLLLEITDLENGTKATFYYSGSGPELVIPGGRGATFFEEPPPVTFTAPPGTTIFDFDGFASYSTNGDGTFSFGGGFPPGDPPLPFEVSPFDSGLRGFRDALVGGKTVGRMDMVEGSLQLPPNPIVKGSSSVFIHGHPAARWSPSGDVSACGSFLGDLKQAATRTVFIG